MSTEIIADADHKMARAVEAMERDFQGLRTGRASTALVERIHVEYYGTSTPLNQLAGISVPEPHQIVIQPWDRGVLGAIEKAIIKSDIGLMPNVDGTVVRLNIPPLTEERRKDIVRSVHKRMEEARVEIRNLRRDAADQLKREERDGDIGHGRGASRARDAPADDRPAHRRGRPPRRGEGTGGPRGLVARAPLARPTDAPPAAHEPARETDRRRPGRPRRGAAAAPRGAAAPRRDHHGRQPALGAPARPVRARRPRGRRRGDPRAAPPRGPARRPGPDAVRVQPRELGPLRRGGHRACSACSRRPSGARPPSSARRASGSGCSAGSTSCPEATRASIDEALGATAGGDRLLLNIAFNYAGRTELVDAFRRLAAERHRRPTRSTRQRSARRCTPPACPIRTWSSGPAASSACRTS